jgi:alpha-1,3-glucosyltransferase
MRRIFPLQRGLFEGKVSNLWCALSVRPLRLRQRIPLDLQPFAALALTLTLLGPVSYCMFRAGRRGTGTWTRSTVTSTILTIPQRQLLWGATNSALAFFLASFQVHEKSLLLALAPCSLLFLDNPDFVACFSIVTTWTIWPLMQIDQLQTAYACTLSIFGSTLGLWRLWMTPNEPDKKRVLSGTFFQAGDGWRGIIRLCSRWIPVLPYTVMSLLHVMEWQIPPRKGLPDLYPVLWSIMGCGFCFLAWIVSTCRLQQMDRHEVSTLRLQEKQKFS